MLPALLGKKHLFPIPPNLTHPSLQVKGQSKGVLSWDTSAPT